MKFNKFWIKEEGKEYDHVKRKAAGQRAVLYYLAALYIGYMGYRILSSRLSGDATISYPIAVIITSVLFLGAAFIIWYATRYVKREFDESVLENTKKEEEQ